MSASESRSAVVMGLAEEFLERCRQGQRPSLKEYIDRHPELAAEIKEVFPAMALMENIALDDESLAGAPTGPETASGAAPPEQLGDYRILREVGRGGMGIVYEAEQVSLGRHVALKVLPRKVLLDDAQKRRFEREAKAAAKLHHTNIVPVFGVGEHDGLPYYVMQFIQGLGLNDVLDELKRMQGRTTPGEKLRVSRKDISAADMARSLLTGAFPDGEPVASASGAGGVSPLSASQGANAPRSGESATSKLSSSVVLPRVKGKKATYWQSVAHIGIQVADALEYAHKQGIQHRDIKPSNLVLDTAGTVWVTDFGLARVDNEDHLTQTGDIVGTLRYMPPEAFEGQADKRGDIYSLGLTLYELLARKPAFEERERHRLIKRVTTEEPSRLDRLNRAIPRDLVTIVHKAIDREPSRRYPTAGELSADLRRFLDDEPIQARRISHRERLLRWCRHHPGVATLTAALAVILLAVTVVSLVAAARFDFAREKAEKAQKQAEANFQEAEQQKQRAEANFAKAQKAVDEYFIKVSESQLLQVSGMQPLRPDLLQSALTFYQDFLQQHSDDPALRGELAAAFLRVGKIRGELGKGAEARKAYEQARELYEALTKAAPESVEWRHGLAQCYYWLGRYDEAVALWEKLVQPGQPRFQKELADAYFSRASNFTNARRLADALQDEQQALAIREMLVRLNPDDSDAQRHLGSTLNGLGVLLDRKGRSEEALAMYRRAGEHFEVAFAQAPQVIYNGRSLAVQQNNIAIRERGLEHVNEALAAYRRVVEVWRKLARDNPAVPSLHSSLFGAYRNLALYQREQNQMGRAEQTMRLAREVIDRLPRDGADALFNLACVRADCSTLLVQGKEKPTAEDRAEQKHEADLAMETLRNAVAAGFYDTERLGKEAELNALRGRDDFKALQADLIDRIKRNQKVQTLRPKQAQADPSNRRRRADLAASQHAIALLQHELGKPDAARKHLDRAIALREALAKEEPKNVQYQADLTESRFVRGELSWRAGRLAEAAKTWQRELDAMEAAATQRGQDRSLLTEQLFAMRWRVAKYYGEAGLWPEAAEHCGRLLQRWEVTSYGHFCAACLALLAGDVAAYRRVCEAMVKRCDERPGFHLLGFLSWACILADGSGTDPSKAIAWVQKMGTPNDWHYRILALAHYRAGRFAGAIEQASRSINANATVSAQMLNWPVLAMAHHRLGHAAESRKWLETTLEEWRRLSPLTRFLGGTTAHPVNSVRWTNPWQDWLEFEVLLREASLLIAGAPPREDAFHHAHRSMLYTRLGNAEKAEAEWQTAIRMAPDEPALRLARGRVFAELGQHDKAEAEWLAAARIAPREPTLWLARGRVFAQLGQHEKADADFAKAAALTPDELNKFPEAGWWVVGPYPEDLKLPCPPEKDPDPSRPVAALGSADQLHWQPAPTDSDGRVWLRSNFNADHIAAYALTYVYSTDERTATLLVGGDNGVRVWLNGQLVHQTTRLLDWAWDLDRVPVTLKAGRNTLLCKISQDWSSHYLCLRIADNPLDRARLHAQLGLWDEAAAEFARGLDRQPSTDAQTYRVGTHAQLAAGDTAAYRQYLDRLFERHDKDSGAAFEPVYAGVLRDGAVKAARLVELAEFVLERDKHPWCFHVAGLASYRAGQFEKAIGRLEQSLKDLGWQSGAGHASELAIALACHRLGHAKDARQWLDKAEQWYDKAIQDALASPTGTTNLCYWMDWPSFVVLRREAHKLILGTDLKDDPRLKQLADRMRDRLKKLDPATVDYDVAILLSPNEPRLWQARAQRLTELKRTKEAGADIAKAQALSEEQKAKPKN